MKKLLISGASALSLISTIAAQSYTYENDNAATGLGFGIMTMYCICVLGLFLIWGGISYLIYKDAVKNNVDNPILWALLTFFFGVIGLLIYFLVAKNKETK